MQRGGETGRNVRFLISSWMKICTWNFSVSDHTNPTQSRKIGIVSFIKFYVENMNKKRNTYIYVYILYLYIYIIFHLQKAAAAAGWRQDVR